MIISTILASVTLSTGFHPLSRLTQATPNPIAAERNRLANEMLQGWQYGTVDAAEAIGTLHRLALADPYEADSFCYDLARVLQGEGRANEAANWYWAACHTPKRRGAKGDPLPPSTWNRFRSPSLIIARITDGLEDVGRSQDAKWVLSDVGLESRRELYLPLITVYGVEPEWQLKWALKLQKDSPKDEEVKKTVMRLRKSVADRATHPEQFVISRDIPRLVSGAS